jgi:4'-phosphopantetheinyl transferase
VAIDIHPADAVRTINNAGFIPHEPLTLRPDEVALWKVDLDAVADGETRWKAILTPDELGRAQRFHFERDRLHFSAARALLRVVLAGYLSIRSQEIRFRYLEKGKPELDGNSASKSIRFNVSHSGGVALFGFTRGHDIGVDVEKIRTDFDTDAIARRFFSQREQEELASLPEDRRHSAFFRYWALKESFIKALGEGLSYPLHQFDVTIQEPVLLTTRPDGFEAARWRLQLVDVGPTHAAAFAVGR